MGRTTPYLVRGLFCLALLSFHVAGAQQWVEKIAVPLYPPLKVQTWLSQLTPEVMPQWERFLQHHRLDTLYSVETAQRVEILHHYWQRNFATAKNLIYQWIARFPNSPWRCWTYLIAGDIALRQRQFEEAQHAFTQAAVIAQQELHQRSDSTINTWLQLAWFWQAVAWAHHGQYEDAAGPLWAYLRHYPDATFADESLFLLGLFAESRFDFDSARHYYQQIIQRYPDGNTVVAAYLRMAQIALMQRSAESVLANVEAARTILDSVGDSADQTQRFVVDPEIQLLYLEAEAYGMLGQFAKAASRIEQALSLISQSRYQPYLVFSQGWIQLNRQRYDEALELFDQIIFDTTAPRLVRAAAQLYYAVGLVRQSDTVSAVRILEGLTRRADYPFRGAALLELGQIYYQQRQLDQARRVLEEAEGEAEEVRTKVHIALLLGSLYLSQQLYTAAVRVYQQAEQLAQQAVEHLLPEKRLHLAEIYYRGGVALVGAKRFAEAISWFNRFLSTYTDDPRRADVLFWLAEAYYHGGMYRNALAYYTALLEQFPATPHRESILYGIGWSHFRLRQFAKATAAFERLLREFPNSRYALDALARKADALYLRKKFHRAATVYRQVVVRAPQNEISQYCAYQVAQSLYRIKDYEGVLRETKRFLRLYPYAPLADDALYLHAWTLFQLQRFDEAIEAFQRLLRTYRASPLRERAHYAIADAYYNAGNYSDAIVTYQQFIEHYPNSPLAASALQSIQYCYVLLGQQEEAETVVEQFTQKFPQTPLAQELYWRKADALFASGEYRDAAEEFQAFLEQYPNSERVPEAWYWLAKSYVAMAEGAERQRLLQQADSLFRQLVKSYPESPFALQAIFERARIAKMQGQIAVADSLWAVLAQRVPDSLIGIKALFERAYLREQQGDTSAAMTLYRLLAQRYAATDLGKRSRFRIAAYYRDRRQYDSARSEFAHLVDEDSPLAAEAQYWIGELWLRQKNYTEAVSAFQKVKQRFQKYERWYLLALLNLGYCYEQLGKPRLAAEHYRLVLALRSDDQYARTARARLQKLQEETP